MAKIVNTEAWATVNSTNGTNLPLEKKKKQTRKCHQIYIIGVCWSNIENVKGKIKRSKNAAMKRYANRLLAVCVFSFMAGRLGDEMKSIFKRLVMIAVKSQLNWAALAHFPSDGIYSLIKKPLPFSNYRQDFYDSHHQVDSSFSLTVCVVAL